MMKSETVTNIPGLPADATVSIWRMSNGFKTDFQAACSDVTVEPDPVTRKPKTTVVVTPSKARIYLLVYGIWEAPSLGIPALRNERDELTAAELLARKQAVRALDYDTADYLYDKISDLNQANADLEELEKK